MGSEVVGVCRLFFLVLGDELFALRCTNPCDEGGGCIRARVRRGDVDPCCITDDNAILFLGDDSCEEAVFLALGKVGGLQLRECPPEFVFQRVDGFWGDDAC